MRVNLSNAVSFFFPNPTLQSVYFEAIANSIDASATEIDISVSVSEIHDPDDFTVTIADNGVGFKDERFNKFCTLLEKEEEEHKGVGRLVFLKYFKKVHVVSNFDSSIREFTFDREFSGESQVRAGDGSPSGTVMTLSDYTGERVKSYDYVIPDRLRASVLQHFLPQLYQLRLNGRELRMTFSLETTSPKPDQGFVNAESTLDLDDLPDLNERSFEIPTVSMFEQFRLLYSVRKEYESPSVITAISADGRTLEMDILSNGSIPEEYEAVFVLTSDYLTGSTSSSRDSVSLDSTTLRAIKTAFRREVGAVIKEMIPEIGAKNDEVHEQVSRQFPHLEGYFETESVGLIDKIELIDGAQRRFFLDQKATLEAEHLDDEQYEKSLEVSSRLLTEYVLYRNKIILRLKEMTEEDSETDIHEILAPRRQRFHQSGVIQDIFRHNAWILDDKFMSYSTILSEKTLAELYDDIEIDVATLESSGSRNKRPDIAIIFSGDPEGDARLDVVIVELKRLGTDLAGKEEVVSQLRQRARRLLLHYPSRIQRIWFYGVTGFDDEFRLSLREDEFAELYSTGDLYYKSQQIYLDVDDRQGVPAGLFVLSYDALLSDAEARNSSFLKLLREGLKREASPSTEE
ncbi:MAG: ATP-binding protein [Alkalispirochaeta sp.]